jgi:site-specific recombinase XerD
MNHTARECLQATIKKIDGAYAPSTIRAYKSNFENFIQYCDENNTAALPATSEIVASYIKKLSAHLKSSSIKIAVASIAALHNLNSLNDPTQHPDVKIEMRRMYRILGRYAKQAYAINRDLLEKMIDLTGINLRGLRDRALLYVAYDTMCRRSELTSFFIEDLVITNRTIKICLRKSKTDQEQIGQWLSLKDDTYKAIETWLKASKIKHGKLFRGIKSYNSMNAELTNAQINRIYKKYARLINLSDINISGHSIRIGATQDLLKSGASLAAIMQKGRWSKVDTVLSYVRNL